jgi:hypothetical protein
MSTETEGFNPESPEADDAAPAPRKVRARKPVYRVRRITDTGEDPQLFKFDEKAQAHRYVETNHPRGRAVYVEHPDGYQEHYSADLNSQGHDGGGWQEMTDEEVDA